VKKFGPNEGRHLESDPHEDESHDSRADPELIASHAFGLGTRMSNVRASTTGTTLTAVAQRSNDGCHLRAPHVQREEETGCEFRSVPRQEG
jgi:hypothetical protein